MSDQDKTGKEFRGRLEGIVGAMRLLLDSDLTPEQRAIAEGTLERGRSLVTMLDALGKLPSAAPKEPTARRFDGADTPMDVVIAEDNDINARIVARVLSKLGVKYRRAANGAEAVAACDERLPDLVLMDIKMPVLDGFEATRQLRRSYGSDLPIVALTSASDADDRRACFAAGMDQFLAKPFSTEELAAVLSWVRARRREAA